MRIIATVTDARWGLVDQVEVTNATDSEKAAYKALGWAKEYDDTKPLPPKGIGNYEPGLSYPDGWFVFKDGNAVYQSTLANKDLMTSTTWVAGEWTLILQGVVV